MKKLSDTYKELGVDFTFPIKIKDADGNQTYYENSNGFWCRQEYDANGNETYCEDRDGPKRGTPTNQRHWRIFSDSSTPKMT